MSEPVEAAEEEKKKDPPRTFPYVQTLVEAIDAGGRMVTELEWQKFKLKHVLGLDLGDGTQLKISAQILVDIATSATNQPPSVLGELGAEDATELMDVASDFLAGFGGK